MLKMDILQVGFEVCFVCWLLFGLCLGSGKVWVRMVSFDNPSGEGDNGHCCDGRAFFCFGKCDHKFTLCLDDSHGPHGTWHCAYGRKQTGEIPERNSMNFYSNVAGLRNPMTFAFNRWPGSMRIKVYVEDVDDNDNDFIDYMYNYITRQPTIGGYGQPVRMIIRDRVRLVVEVKVYCNDGFYGNGCDVYCRQRDDSTGHYTCDRTTGRKICMSGWVGPDCNRNHDDCASSPCHIHATCIDMHMGFSCICPDGRTGKTCKVDHDECQSSPCANNATCLNLPNAYSCACSVGWTGSNCQQAVDFCATSQPCVNNGTCFNTGSSYRCDCSAGWYGPECDVQVDECASSPCKNNATCVDLINDVSCSCQNGTSGKYCEADINECETEPPCRNEGICRNTNGSFECTCTEFYEGDLCQFDKNECLSTKCEHNGTCVNTNGSFYCECPTGYTGTYCDLDLDECKSSPCHNNGTCEDHPGKFSCSCKDGFYGMTCEHDIDECLSNPCFNNGTCVNAVGLYVCDCVDGYTGTMCETQTDDCESSPCISGSTCVNMVGGFQCRCLPGFTSRDCSVRQMPVACDETGTDEGFILDLPKPLYTDEVNSLQDMLVQMLVTFAGRSPQDISMNLKPVPRNNVERTVVTEVSVCVMDGISRVSNSELQSVFTEDRLLQATNGIPQYISERDKGDNSVVPTERQTATKEKVNWIADHWYTLAIIGGVALLLAIPTILFIRKKRKYKEVQIDRSAYWAHPPEFGLGFENTVYLDYQPNTLLDDDNVIPSNPSS